MTDTAIIPAPQLDVSVIDIEPQARLSTWVIRYWQDEVEGSSPNTLEAKRHDLQLFLDYFAHAVRSDDLSWWTRSITRGFLRWLETDANEGRGYAATTINRVLATVRHFARFIAARGGFVHEDPLHGIAELVIDEPAWKGLTDVQVTRIRAALDQLDKLMTRKNQLPRRNRAIVLVFFGTGIRVSELLRLDLADYRGKHFWNVKRKGKNRTRKIYVPKEAREALEDYIDHERGRDPGPLFISKGRERLARQHVDRFLRQLAGQANAKLPPEEHIQVHAHKLRHTVLGRAANKHGVHYAKELSGHVSDRHIWRYVQPSEEEKEAAQEDLL